MGGEVGKMEETRYYPVIIKEKLWKNTDGEIRAGA